MAHFTGTGFAAEDACDLRKIRVNQLARELQVRVHEILDLLPTMGVAGKTTHSSWLSHELADNIRRHFQFAMRKASASSQQEPRTTESHNNIDLQHSGRPSESAEPPLEPTRLRQPIAQLKAEKQRLRAKNARDPETASGTNLIQCPHCDARLREKRLPRHLKRRCPKLLKAQQIEIPKRRKYKLRQRKLLEAEKRRKQSRETAEQLEREHLRHPLQGGLPGSSRRH
jgi:hypothetical protein